MTFEEKTIESKSIYHGYVFNLRQDIVQVPGGKTSVRDIIEHTGGVGIAALTKEGKMIMIRQFRKAAEQVVWEIPAGKIEPGEDTRSTAERELREETGYAAENFRKLTAFYGTIGYDTEVIEIFRADATTKGETDFDESEAIDLYEMDVKELVNMVYSGEIIDGKTIVSVLMVARELGV